MLETANPKPLKGGRSLLRALGSRVDQPEKRLMLAVLEDAIDTVVPGGRAAGVRERRLRQAAEAWLAADDHAWPFSFVCVCQALDLDPARVRRALASTRRARVAAEEAAVDVALPIAGRDDWRRRWIAGARG